VGHEMSRLFESFEFLDRGWDVRVLESQSLRSIFLWLLPLVFVLGADTALMTYQIFHLHRLNWSMVFNLPVLTLLAVRYARLVYRRLG
jgi:hypothetical protein